MEQDYRLAEGEYRFACLVWANEPLGSRCGQGAGRKAGCVQRPI